MQLEGGEEPRASRKHAPKTLGDQGADHEAEPRGLGRTSGGAQVVEGGPNGGDAARLGKEGPGEAGGEGKYGGWRVSAGRDSQSRGRRSSSSADKVGRR